MSSDTNLTIVHIGMVILRGQVSPKLKSRVLVWRLRLVWDIVFFSCSVGFPLAVFYIFHWLECDVLGFGVTFHASLRMRASWLVLAWLVQLVIALTCYVKRRLPWSPWLGNLSTSWQARLFIGLDTRHRGRRSWQCATEFIMILSLDRPICLSWGILGQWG